MQPSNRNGTRKMQPPRPSVKKKNKLSKLRQTKKLKGPRLHKKEQTRSQNRN
jgi:hypothetical protein